MWSLIEGESHTGTNFVPTVPRNGVPSRAILVARSQRDVYGVPMREELVTVCVPVRVDAGSACQAVARISKCLHHGTHWHALSLNSCAIVCSEFTCSQKWHDNFVVRSRNILEIFLNISNFQTCHAMFHPTRVPTHIHNFFPR